MNRKQRRQAVKSGVDGKKLLEITKREGLIATRMAVDAYSVAVAMVLFDKLHFGKKKIQMTLKQIESLFDSIDNDYVTIEDMKQTLAEECELFFMTESEGK